MNGHVFRRTSSFAVLSACLALGALVVACGDTPADDDAPLAEGGTTDASEAPRDAAPARDARTDTGAETSTDAGPDAAPATYALHVTVTGLSATTGDAGLDDAGAGVLVLENGGETISVTANGVATFPTALTAGSTFAVTIAAQPSNPVHTCSVSGGTGTVVSGDVSTVTVNCDVDTFTLGGSVVGLAGSGLRVKLGDTQQVDVTSTDGTYAFPAAVPSGTPYEVTIDTDPTTPWQHCTVANGTGIVAGSNVTNVDVTCETLRYVVHGTVSGLPVTGLELINTVGADVETLAIAANATTFAFATPVPSGSVYTVATSALPAGYTCTVENATGTMAGADVGNVAVVCRQSVFDLTATGAEQTFVVPAGVTSIDVTLEGAQGGSVRADSVNFGGKVAATLAVTPGETLSLFVGTQPVAEEGGFNGGGAGDGGGRGGGGATDIRRGGNTLAHRILVAGGGGGGGDTWNTLPINGGVGGGLAGGAGDRAGTEPGGAGGTQTGSGTGTCVAFGVAAVSGDLGIGGTTSGKGCGCQGYGGGGGYYGGSASGNCRGGGGGSAFTPAAGVSNVVNTAGGARPGSGHLRLDVH